MKKQMAPEFVASFWDKRFPGQIPDRLVAAEPLVGDRLELEGHDLVVVGLGHTDTDDTTCLHVPSIDLVVAGDAVYNDVHLYFAESPAEGRRAWLDALDTVAALEPEAVVSGHKNPDRPDDPNAIAETRRYIHDFEAVAEHTETSTRAHCGARRGPPRAERPGRGRPVTPWSGRPGPGGVSRVRVRSADACVRDSPERHSLQGRTHRALRGTSVSRHSTWGELHFQT
ncbi:MBL fold metallo-hydrolase [Streptomyces mirabilis]|uniref:MBL fold metallo-hydrolase n=1 Tax=Streptomyces mirabilis TaxID=68239 RepID=UPI003250781D